jgi:hypothetical protein
LGKKMDSKEAKLDHHANVDFQEPGGDRFPLTGWFRTGQAGRCASPAALRVARHLGLFPLLASGIREIKRRLWGSGRSRGRWPCSGPRLGDLASWEWRQRVKS